jgi:hypothetical protein
MDGKMRLFGGLPSGAALPVAKFHKFQLDYSRPRLHNGGDEKTGNEYSL